MRVLRQFNKLSKQAQKDIRLGRQLRIKDALEVVELKVLQDMGHRDRMKQCHGVDATLVYDIKRYCSDSSAPNLDVEDMEPLSVYAVEPDAAELAEYDIELMSTEAVFVVTRESLLSLREHLKAIAAAGFDVKKLALDGDGKWKLVRENWVFISYGGRMVMMDNRENKFVQTFVPFGWLVAPSEKSEYAIFGYVALQVRRVRSARGDKEVRQGRGG